MPIEPVLRRRETSRLSESVRYFGDQPCSSLHTLGLWSITAIMSSCHGHAGRPATIFIVGQSIASSSM